MINYTITLLNSGNVTLTNRSVTGTPGPVNCPGSPTTLAPGASLVCSSAYTITQADLDAGSVTNLANATMKFGTQTISANPATATSTAVQTPALLLTKSGTLPASPIKAGDAITYSYVLKNTGNVTLVRPITVSDDKVTVTCPSGPATLAPGASLTCSAAYILLAADITAGSVTNTATARAVFHGAVDFKHGHGYVEPGSQPQARPNQPDWHIPFQEQIGAA